MTDSHAEKLKAAAAAGAAVEKPEAKGSVGGSAGGESEDVSLCSDFGSDDEFNATVGQKRKFG